MMESCFWKPFQTAIQIVHGIVSLGHLHIWYHFLHFLCFFLFSLLLQKIKFFSVIRLELDYRVCPSRDSSVKPDYGSASVGQTQFQFGASLLNSCVSKGWHSCHSWAGRSPAKWPKLRISSAQLEGPGLPLSAGLVLKSTSPVALLKGQSTPSMTIAQTNNKTALLENTAPNVILCAGPLSKSPGGISLPGRL